MVQCIAALRVDPQLEPDMNTLSDMREIEVAFTAQGVSSMVEVMETTADRRSAAKAAIVVSTDVAFGMGRMLQGWSGEHSDPSFRIFRDLPAAHEWLGIV